MSSKIIRMDILRMNIGVRMAAETFADRLKGVRKDIKKTQKEMADLMGVSLPTYMRYEKGARIPDINFANRVADLSGCDVGWLLSGRHVTNGLGEGRVAESQKGFDANLMADIIQAVEELFEDQGLSLTPQKKAQLLEVLYEDQSEERADMEKLKGKILKFTRLAS